MTSRSISAVATGRTGVNEYILKVQLHKSVHFTVPKLQINIIYKRKSNANQMRLEHQFKCCLNETSTLAEVLGQGHLVC